MNSVVPSFHIVAPLVDPSPKQFTVGEVLGAVDELPAMADVAMKVARMVEDPSVSALAISRVVATDQGLTTRILKLANSAYYGLSRRIGTVQEAVVILGLRTIKQLTIAASMFPSMNREMRGYALGRGELWRHSLSVAICAQALATRVRPADPSIGPVAPDEAFVAGLLHDMGKIVLSVHLRDYLPRARARALADKVPFLVAERESLGVDHAEVGAAMAEKWNFPASLVEAIAFHHDPFAASHGCIGLACVTHLADALCLMMGIGIGGDGLHFHLNTRALEAIGLSADVENLMNVCLDALQQNGPTFDLDSPV